MTEAETDDPGELAVFDDSKGYRIGWYFEDEGDFGGMLGEDPNLPAEAPVERASWEHWIANKTAASFEPEKDTIGFFWESAAKAKKALRSIKEAMKTDKPMPEWATMALANGWKPPKSWKP